MVSVVKTAIRNLLTDYRLTDYLCDLKIGYARTTIEGKLRSLRDAYIDHSTLRLRSGSESCFDFAQHIAEHRRGGSWGEERSTTRMGR